MTLHNLSLDEFERKCGVTIGIQEKDYGLGYRQIDTFLTYPDARDEDAFQQMTGRGWYQKEASVWLVNNLKPEMVFLDTLADVGYFTFLGAVLVGTGGWVISMEHRQDKLALFKRGISQNRIWRIAEVNRNTIMDSLDDVMEHIGQRPRVDFHRISADGKEYHYWKNSTKFRKRDRPIVMVDISHNPENFPALLKSMFNYGSVSVVGVTGKEIPIENGKQIEEIGQTIIVRPE